MPKAGSRRRDYSEQPATNKNGPVFADPHSPWQLMIEAAREEHQLSIREVAQKANVPAGTLFNWLRGQRGFPLKRYYNEKVNDRLARALHLKPEGLLKAYAQSAIADMSLLQEEASEYRTTSRPAPRAPDSGKFSSALSASRLIQVLEATGKESFTVAQIKAIVGTLEDQ